ncbi:hypothetical protein DFJ73DRAFT_435781 [Zopfochytrium polystomum]|nr:hypothetical protein DFJ73DRAFT_435781 [Zopfochytrium polystomum]
MRVRFALFGRFPSILSGAMRQACWALCADGIRGFLTLEECRPEVCSGLLRMAFGGDSSRAPIRLVNCIELIVGVSGDPASGLDRHPVGRRSRRRRGRIAPPSLQWARPRVARVAIRAVRARYSVGIFTLALPFPGGAIAPLMAPGWPEDLTQAQREDLLLCWLAAWVNRSRRGMRTVGFSFPFGVPHGLLEKLVDCFKVIVNLGGCPTWALQLQLRGAAPLADCARK